MLLRHLIIFIVFFIPISSLAQSNLYRVNKSNVSFTSNAPLELIEASSQKLEGILDTSKCNFAFKIFIASFDGFNNPLQREHFNENYMETIQYPIATYVGKIIENIDYSQTGSHWVRTKGKLSIHGITRERIIKAEITMENGEMEIKADFSVLLSDYNIKIPKIVGNNLANEIKTKVVAILIPH